MLATGAEDHCRPEAAMRVVKVVAAGGRRRRQHGQDPRAVQGAGCIPKGEDSSPNGSLV